MKIDVSNRLMKTLDRLKRRGIILMYHRIVDQGFNPRQLSVSPKNFNEHMQVIKKHGHPVSMGEMGKGLHRFSLGMQEIVITFDDGYADNFYNAAPILKEHGIPATFFIISGSIGSQEEFFWDDLEQVILAPQTLPKIFEAVINKKKYHWEIIPQGPCQAIDYSKEINDDPQNTTDLVLSRSQLYLMLNQILAPLKLEERKDALEQLAEWAGHALTTRSGNLPMGLGDLASLSDCTLFEIGAHTVSHPRLSLLSLEKQEDEIARSKSDLENILNRPVNSFSYPYGNYSDETVRIVERLKFKNACTVVQQPVARRQNPCLLPRFSVLDWNGDEFERNLENWLVKECHP